MLLLTGRTALGFEALFVGAGAGTVTVAGTFTGPREATVTGATVTGAREATVTGAREATFTGAREATFTGPREATSTGPREATVTGAAPLQEEAAALVVVRVEVEHFVATDAELFPLPLPLPSFSLVCKKNYNINSRVYKIGALISQVYMYMYTCT